MVTTNRTDKPVSKKKKKKKPNSILDREQPFNLEAERGVLGSIMLLPDMCDEIVSIVRTEDFYDEANAKLFEHLTTMHGTAKKIDMTLLRERLAAHGDLEFVGGAAKIAKIFTSVHTPAHATYYAKIVQEKAVLRTLIGTCIDILGTAFEPLEEPESLLNQAEQKIFAIREGRQGTSLSQIEESLQIAIDRLEARAQGINLTGSVDCGFTDLDAMTNGLHGSELVILAARPSMGKTAFALNIAENVVTQSKRPVLFISLEMAAVELTERLMCSYARVNGHRLRSGTLPQEARKKLIKSAGELSQCPLYIDDSPTRNVSEIAAGARRIMRQEDDLALIVIDYLQLIEPDNSRDPRQEQVAKIARRLKGLARELEVPILCLAQLNRQAESTGDNLPKLSHLRESGAIEQDADVVMFVHRKDYYKSKGGEDDGGEDLSGQAQIIIAKQRNGPVGNVDLTWLRDFTRFEDRAPERFDEFD